jgi:pentatricopeptide repeat protein
VQVFERMQAAKVSPNEFAYTSLMNAYTKRGRVEQAFALFRQMHDDPGVEPNLFIYTTLMAGLTNANLWELAVEVFELMVSRGVEPDQHALNVLIRAYASGPRAKTEEALERMRASGNLTERTYSSLLMGCAGTPSKRVTHSGFSVECLRKDAPGSRSEETSGAVCPAGEEFLGVIIGG